MNVKMERYNMERLTEKRDGQNVIPLRQDRKVKWALCNAGKGDSSTQYLYGEHVHKLADYENTGYPPEQVVEMAKELAELKRQLPPCKAGDTIYVVPSKVNYDLNILHKYYDNNRVYEQEVSEIRLYSNGYLIVTCEGMCSVVDVSYKETWFLTKEAAEAKLKEMEGK
nr:MAG TPA: hypothetical protein [Caudoviricetes sp.]